MPKPCDQLLERLQTLQTSIYKQQKIYQKRVRENLTQYRISRDADKSSRRL